MIPIIVIHKNIPHADEFKENLTEILKETYLIIWETEIHSQNFHQIEVVIVWRLPIIDLDSLKQLKLVLCCGSGVDGIIQELKTLTSVTVVRLIDYFLRDRVANYVVMSILNYYYKSMTYFEAKQDANWVRVPCSADKPKIGVMGVGMIGELTIKKLVTLGFEVYGWARNSKKSRVMKEMYYGASEITKFAQQSDILVCMLPLTKDTHSIINNKLLKELPKNAYIINVGRGEHIVEEDLLKYLDAGHLSGACLDVFIQEPLPLDHPFWRNNKIIITPHIAGGIFPGPQAEYAAKIIINLNKNLLDFGVVDFELSY